MTKVIPNRDDLEIQKLALEIRELQRRWWQRPVYLSILLPIVLGTLTFLAGILSGYFDRERVQLKRDIQVLKRENSALVETQNTIRQANADARKHLQETNFEYERQRQRIDEAWKMQTGDVQRLLEQLRQSLTSPTPKPKNKDLH